MNLTKRATAWFLTLVMVLSMMPQTVFAKDKIASSLQHEVFQEISEDKTKATISLEFTETETVQLEKVTLPDGVEKTEDLASVTYTVSENGTYDFTVDYTMDGEKQEETIPVEVVELEEQKTDANTPNLEDEKKNAGEQKVNDKAVSADENEIQAEIQLKGATFFDGTPWSGTTQTIMEYNREVPYNGWQLMQLTVEIPYQDGLEITSIQPSAESIYPEYSEIKKDDANSKWTYKFYFYDNGIYDFKINYTLNGTAHSLTKSYTVEGLVAIKDTAMRRHLINNYGEFSGLDHQGGQYLTEEILSTPQYDPWGNLVFDFGKDGDNGSTAKYTTSLDGLQYLKNIHGMYLFDCSRLALGETIEPITNTYYPNMKQLRITEITENSTNLPKDSYTPEMIAKAISNMPNLRELSLSGTGFKDFPVIGQLNGQLDYIKCNYNNVESIEGIEKHEEIGTLALGRNKIKSIEPLGKSKFDSLRFLDLGGNQIFDLSPMKTSVPNSIVGGRTFSAKSQTITYPKTVITTLENGMYKIELPMPIDIDGTLTDTDTVTVKLSDNSTKEYTTSKLDGKTYISIPETDVDSSKKNPFENAKFSFSFNNNKGKDSRTKGYFTGTVSFKVSPFEDEYNVIYEFVSGTRGKELPEEITELLPVDSAKYAEGTTINAIQPEKTEVAVTDGVWKFKGYDAESKEANADNSDESGNIKFTGTWEFEVNNYTVNYSFESADKDKELPEEIKTQLPEAGNVEHGKTVSAPTTTFENVTVTDGTWTFKGWTPDKYENVTANVAFVGTWEFKVNNYTVNYSFESADKDKELPEEIKTQLPEAGNVEHGKTVSAPTTTFENVAVTDGTWTFKGWTPAQYEDVTEDVTFVGTWEFRKNASIINRIPTISASDKTLTVGDDFDPRKDVTATDVEDGDLTKEIEILKNEVDTSEAGVYEVTYKVTDSKGASSVKTIYVTVNPKMEALNHIPVINANDKTLTVGDEFDPRKDVTATDKEDGDLTKEIEVLKNEVDTSEAGVYEVTYKVTDSKGASSVKTIYVTVNPKMEALNHIPVINASDKTLTVGDEFNPRKDVTATDVEDGDLTKEIEILKNEVDTSEAGVYEVTYKVTDSKGASSVKTIYVTVNPKMEALNHIPVINASDKTLTVGDEFNPRKDVTATDVEDGDLTKEIEILKNEVDTSEAGVYEVTYKVTDSKGASSVKTIYVTVNPKMEALNHIPVINASDKTLTVGDEFNPRKDVTATDVEDGDLTKEIEILKNEVDTSEAGVYEVTYKVTDSKGVSSVKTIYVTVNPKMEALNHIPVINASDKTLTVGDKFDPRKDVTATDKEDGDLTKEIEILKNEVDTTKAGVYEVAYKVTDSEGASSVKTIYVTVNPKMEALNHIPVINASDKTLTVGDKFDPRKDVTATDKEDGDLTKEIEVLKNEVDTSKAGVYAVTYKVTDSKGASSTKTIYVTVKAKETPVVPNDSDNQSNKPNTDKEEGTDTPKTGDASNAGMWILLMIVSLVSLAGVAALKKRHKN